MAAKRPFLFAIIALGVGLNVIDAAAEAPYPSRLTKVIVPFPAGGSSDIIARSIAGKLSASLKQTFIVENRPGAAGNLGIESVVKAAPDGYTLGVAIGTTLTANPSLYRSAQFDLERDLRPIAVLTMSGNMLVVHPSVPVRTVAEFVAYAKATAATGKPILYASGGGNGTPGHLVMEYFRMRAGFEATQVAYRGNPQAVVDLIAGHVKTAFIATAGMMDQVRAGQLKGLGVSQTTRSLLAPEVPTIAESGYPDFRVQTYVVMVAPAGIPEPIAALLEREVQAALKSPDLIEELRGMDTTPLGIIGADAKALLEKERNTWVNVIRAAHLQVE
jgi:tripartite-type tricarboxylate transporter receptor subunit TctC